MSDSSLISKTPEYGGNYKRGYVGFSFFDTSVVSNGIAYMTRRARRSEIKVSHALLVTGENECIESIIGDGVVKSPLDKYFDDESCQIYFRKPKGLTTEIADIIIGAATQQLDTEYDNNLIVSQAISGSFIGHLANRFFSGKPEELISSLLNQENRWICSELVSYCLEQYESYQDLGILAHPSETIDPQELFEDDVVFKPWHFQE